MPDFKKMELEELLAFLPSRIYYKTQPHGIHQLVIEKFPNHTWSVSYVCLDCKGKTQQFIDDRLQGSLCSMAEWYRDVYEKIV